MTALKYWVALNRISGLGPKKFEMLEAHFRDLEFAWKASAHDLVAAGLDRDQAARVVADRTSIDPDDEMARMGHAGVTAVARPEPDYPSLLREIYDPPPVLYLRGSHGLTPENGLAVVGTRSATPYGRDVTARLVTDLAAAGLTIVSGLPRGSMGSPTARPWKRAAAPLQWSALGLKRSTHQSTGPSRTPSSTGAP